MVSAAVRGSRLRPALCGSMERTARDRADGPRPSNQPVGTPRAARSAPELAVLLLELASIVKARAFFAPGDAKLAHAFERCLRTWRSDLARHGALELAVGAGGFREIGGGGVLQHARLADLLGELRSRGLKAVLTVSCATRPSLPALAVTRTAMRCSAAHQAPKSWFF